mmetsp:Transcript_9290/g.9368  ORF Transcript_9290/g.9368 Transcript_9290/m.9368 type:complete len:126 (+) Transcript_9290:2175-2552(+)
MECKLLRKRCDSIIEAEDGQEAVEKVKMSMKKENKETCINLILMDSMMPVMDGLEATKEIRDVGYKGLIIGVTGNVTADDIESFLKHGADAVLPKPLDVDGFDVVVERLLPAMISEHMTLIPSNI